MIEKFSSLPEFLINRYYKWKSKHYDRNSNKFSELALGQKPKTMVISCCDSRVLPTSFFGVEEGEFFIHKNIANLVPIYSPDENDNGTFAAIEYAIKELKVKHLIVLGHSDCGGIKRAHLIHSKETKLNFIFIDKWLNNILPAFKKVEKNITNDDQINKLSEESIKSSIKNLFMFPDLKSEVENNNLSIHGLIYDIGSGKIKYLNPQTEKSFPDEGGFSMLRNSTSCMEGKTCSLFVQVKNIVCLFP